MDETLKAILDKLNALEAGQQAMQIEMKDDIASLKADMAHHNHYVEPLLKAVKEGVDGLQERNRQLDALDDKVDNHDHRIWALEQKAM